MSCESQLCVASMTDSPVLMVCALTSRPVSYPKWLETNIECRLLDMRIWWCLTSFAVHGRTVGAMVWEIWHEPSVSLSRHNMTGSIFFSELHQLGYWWHYFVSSLSLMILHTRFLTFCCASISTYLYKKQSDNLHGSDIDDILCDDTIYCLT